MTSLNYEEIYSRFYTSVEAYDLISLTPEEANAFLCNWLHLAINNPYTRRLFSKLIMDDEEEALAFEMAYKLDDERDKEFVIEILSYGLVIEWINPKINSLNNTSQVYGSASEKWFSQAAHVSELRNMKSDYVKRQRKMIGDRGYINNTYLDG